MKILGPKLLVRKCVSGVKETFDGHEWYMVGGIALTQARGEHQNWCEIVDVGDECEYFKKEYIGGLVLLPEYSYIPHAFPKSRRKGADGHLQKDFFFRLSDDEFVVREELFKIPTKEGGAPMMVYFPE